MKVKSPRRNTKIPVVPATDHIYSSDDKHPIFALEFLDGDYCITKCDKDERAAFSDTIHRLSKQSWRELKLRGRHKGGCEKISRNQMKFKIPDIFSNDMDCIVFRFSGLKPMIGFRKNEVFFIVALDRNFTAYDHG